MEIERIRFMAGEKPVIERRTTSPQEAAIRFLLFEGLAEARRPCESTDRCLVLQAPVTDSRTPREQTAFHGSAGELTLLRKAMARFYRALGGNPVAAAKRAAVLLVKGDDCSPEQTAQWCAKSRRQLMRELLDA